MSLTFESVSLKPYARPATPHVPAGRYEADLGGRVLTVVVQPGGAVLVAGASGQEFRVTGTRRAVLLHAVAALPCPQPH